MRETARSGTHPARGRWDTDAIDAAARQAGGVFDPPQIPFDVLTVPTSDGALLHVHSYGPRGAPPVVLIHGFACRIEYWYPQINALAGNHRVIAYDQRGLGRSTMGRDRVCPDVLADDLAAVLAAALPPGRAATLVGHSFGGITALAFAQRYPDRIGEQVSAVLLADTVAERFAASTMLVPWAGKYGPVRRPLVMAIAQLRVPLPPPALSRRPLRRLALSPAAAPGAVNFAYAVVASCRPDMRAIWGAGLAGTNVAAGVENLTVPTTVLVGLADRITPPVVSQRIADTLRARGFLHRFVQLTGIGHCANLEAPDAFDAEIRRLTALRHPRPDVIG